VKFRALSVQDARGAILAHGTRCGQRMLKKGLVLTANHVAALEEAGVGEVVVAQLDTGDVHEDEAAARCARALAGPGLKIAEPFTGRANLIAAAAGVVVVDVERINQLNRIDEALTVATLPAHDVAEAGQMVATVKVIPFAAPGACVAAWETAAAGNHAALSVAPFEARRVGLILTRTAATADKVLDKTARVVGERVAALGSDLIAERRCSHATAALAAEIGKLAATSDMVLIYGASAITDRRDVIPAAIEAAGGTVEHFGMPVDPGNLLLLARLGDKPVLGLPGCARSPKLNGFDWVLERLMAGLRVTPRDITEMGVGGLLKEIPSRPQPRAEAPVQRAPRIAALVLAAGQSRRMGSQNKLLAEIGGMAMVRHVALALGASQVARTIVVTGHEPERVRQALAGLDVEFVHNGEFEQGLSTSLRTGLAAVAGEIDGVLVCLGDMPGITPPLINRMIAAFNPAEGCAIVLPTHRGKRGNPVLWDRRFFETMKAVSGDVGARHLLGENEELVVEIEAGDDAVLVDIDTPQALKAAQGN